MAQPQNDFWYPYRHVTSNEWRSRIQHLCFKHKYIASFPNFFLLLNYNDAFPSRDGNLKFDKYLDVLSQESETVRKHPLTKQERDKLAEEREFMETCQKNMLTVLKNAAEAMTNNKKNRWQDFYHQNLDWLTREEFGGFLLTSARQGLAFDILKLNELIKAELKPGVDMTKTHFYKELMKINDTCLISRTASLEYFKNRNTGLLSQNGQIATIYNALAVEDPFKEDPSLRTQCLNLYREMKVNTVNDNHHLSLINICNRVKTNESRRSKWS